MKVFLLSDLVVHELISMHLEGRWLTSEQFTESARLWVSRHASEEKLSERFVGELQREAIRIAERLTIEGKAGLGGSPLKCLLRNICDVNYANPLSARVLAASLKACRETLCDRGQGNGEKGAANGRHVSGELGCHAALRLLVCEANACREAGQCDGQITAGACAKAGGQ